MEAFIHDAVRTPRGKGNERGPLRRLLPNLGPIDHVHTIMRHFDLDPDLAATLLDELERRDLEVGLLTIPAAAGIGAALILQRV